MINELTEKSSSMWPYRDHPLLTKLNEVNKPIFSVCPLLWRHIPSIKRRKYYICAFSLFFQRDHIVPNNDTTECPRIPQNALSPRGKSRLSRRSD